MEFTHTLPMMTCDGVKCGNYNNPELEYPCQFNTKEPTFGLFMESLRDCVRNERRLVVVDGKVLFTCHNWIRDGFYMSEVYRHWEHDLRDFFDFLLENQTEEGFFFELLKQDTDEHWKMVNEDCRKLYPQDAQTAVRLELEADVEYIMVLYADTIYKVDGDVEYIRGILPKLEKAIDYMTSSEKRWDPQHGLVKRMYTIDTWDFTNDRFSATDRRIYLDKMCIMHGDNSGVYASMKVLAKFRRLCGDEAKAAEWDTRAEALRQNMITHLWNGRFFVHQLPLTADPLDEHENERLSLSNPYDINRGVTDVAQSRSIIEEYMRRRETTDAFCEWFSIDPPYPMFQTYAAGKYVNGAISPFTAGELALAAFENGYEAYGWDILQRMKALWKQHKKIYFLYSRDGVVGDTDQGPSGWGSASMLKAIEEGLAGIRDEDTGYRVMQFAPRWVVTDYTELRYITGYEKTHTHVDLAYELKDAVMQFALRTPSTEIHAHILLPAGKTATAVTVNDKSHPFTLSTVGESVYADFTVTKAAADKAEMAVTLA